MGYVTHSTTEAVNELSQTTSIHFESFEDFLKWDKMKSCETAELTVSSEGPIEITARNIKVSGEVEDWIPHTTTWQPVDDFVQVQIKWTEDNEIKLNTGRAVDFDWEEPLHDPTRISHYRRIIKPQEE